MEKTDKGKEDTLRIFLHEIKNPITALMFQIENLKDNLPERFVPEVDEMDREIKRLSFLVKEAGTFLQNPVGKPEKLNVSEQLNSIFKPFPATVSLFCPDELFVFFDSDRFNSIFENLIRNASESSLSEDSKVEVSVSKEHNNAVFKVMDRGIGLKIEDTEKLFDFGFTTKENGSGIGLFLVKQFVEANKGSVKLYPRENGGTVAEVVLPCNI